MTLILERPVSDLDVARIRRDFPILAETVHGKPFVYLDSAASAQKPRQVIDAMREAMERQYSNVHRGLHWMSERTTEAYEAARDAVAGLLGGERDEVVFTRNSTEAINLVAHSYGALLPRGAAVLISAMEHHANIVPWQLLRSRRPDISLRVAPVTVEGELDMPAYEALLADGEVALVSITHMSNVLGSYVPAERVVALAHAAGARVLLDGSQAVVHRAVDMKELDCDFYVFTGHKLYGPTGIGVLWARRELLEEMPPFLGGGDMISSVAFEESRWARVPHKFEAGTPPIIEGVGLRAAVDYVRAIGFERIAAHEADLTAYALERMDSIPGVMVLGRARDRGGVIAFTLEGVHAHDVATLLDRQGIAVRAGQHCAEPLLKHLGLHSAARASFGVYTERREIDALATGLERIKTMMG